MIARQTEWPRQWLMTDERIGERLWEAIDRLPVSASGLVFRHYRTPAGERAVLAGRVAEICRRRSLTLAVAADVELARTLRADLIHNPSGPTGELPFSRSVHSLEDAEAARLDGASLVFVSPIYPTRSHPGGETLTASMAAVIAKAAGVPAIALGGMDASKFERLECEGFHGWAGIDAWLKPSRE